MLRTSTLCAAVLVRESERLDAGFRQHASYLIYEEAQEAGPICSAGRWSARNPPLG